MDILNINSPITKRLIAQAWFLTAVKVVNQTRIYLAVTFCYSKKLQNKYENNENIINNGNKEQIIKKMHTFSRFTFCWVCFLWMLQMRISTFNAIFLKIAKCMCVCMYLYTVAENVKNFNYSWRISRNNYISGEVYNVALRW